MLRVEVVVSVITYRRPEGLSRLLESLRELELQPGVALRTLVVDNDQERSAEAVCAEFSARGFRRLEYVVEPKKGIPFARNRAVREAGGCFEYLAFVDDDERVSRGWLRELLRARERFSADVTTGPVLPEFDEQPPAWILRGRFFERRRYPTGENLSVAFTNNVLVSAKVFREVSFWFDEALANTGGSDGEFFRRVHAAGYKIVWADDAIVHETVPATRASPRWLCQRMYRVGTTLSRERFLRHSWPLATAITSAAALRWSAYGLAVLPRALYRGKAPWVEGVRHLCYAGGLVAGALGFRFDEYSSHHGR